MRANRSSFRTAEGMRPRVDKSSTSFPCISGALHSAHWPGSLLDGLPSWRLELFSPSVPGSGRFGSEPSNSPTTTTGSSSIFLFEAAAAITIELRAVKENNFVPTLLLSLVFSDPPRLKVAVVSQLIKRWFELPENSGTPAPGTSEG